MRFIHFVDKNDIGLLSCAMANDSRVRAHVPRGEHQWIDVLVQLIHRR